MNLKKWAVMTVFLCRIYKQLDVLRSLRQDASQELLAESRRHPATRTSGEYRFPNGQLQRSKKFLATLGLNHNHDLKNIFKGAASLTSVPVGPLQDFYLALLAKGTKA